MAGPTIRLTFAGDSTDLERSMDRVGDGADQMERTFSAKSAAMGAAGIAAGGALMAGFASSLDSEDASAKLAAQMGAGSAAAGQAGKVAGELYAGAYGESMSDVGEAVRTVMSSGALSAGATDEQIRSLTANAMTLADTFDQDVTGATNAAAQMMKTGLAPNAEAALDILTVGFQQGNDKAGDLLDTFNEYGTQFRKLGLDGQTAMGLISQGLQGGARDADLVADSLKEFSIIALDGSGADAFKAIGLSGKQMADDIAAGGPRATAALDQTLDRLRGVKDPAERAGLAVSLFGTTAEDMGDALYALDPSAAAAKIGEFGGATQTMNDTLGDTAASKLTAVQRGFEEWKNSIIGVQGPMGEVAAGIFTFGADAIGMAGSLGMAVVGLGQMGIWTKIAAAGQWLFNAALSANPIGLVVIAIAALVGGLIWAWTSSETFRNIVMGVWAAVSGAIGTAAGWIGARISDIAGFFGSLPGRVSGAVSGFVGTVSRGIGDAVGWFMGLPGRVVGAIGNLGSTLLTAGGDLLRGLWNGITGAAGWLRDKIFGFFGDLLPGWARDILGIASPSKVFADLGQYIPAGMAAGIEDNLGVVSIASAKMAAAASRPFDELGDMVKWGQVDEGTWNQLRSAGWTGRAGDGMEAVYRPGGGGGGGTSVTFHGNTTDALNRVIMEQIRTGRIQIGR